MTKDLGECGCLVEIILGSLSGPFSVVLLVEIMMCSGGSGKCGLKGQAVFSLDYQQDFFGLCDGCLEIWPQSSLNLNDVLL